MHGLDLAETQKLFPDLAQNARVDWHDKPGEFWSEIHKQWLEFEGKQQMGYLVTRGDKVFLDCSKVLDNFLKEIEQRVNSPDFGQVEGYFNANGTPFVDPKMMHLKERIIEAINNGDIHQKFQAVVIPTEGANDAGISDLIEGADAQGMIELNGKYDWSKIFIDPATGKIDPAKLHDGKLPFSFLEMRFDGHVMNTVKGLPEVAGMPITEILPPSGNLPPTTLWPFGAAWPRRGIEKRKGRQVFILTMVGLKSRLKREQE